MSDSIIAVDLGGTQVRVARCDATGKIIDRVAQPANVQEGFDAVFARVVAGIRQMAQGERVRGIGLGSPGPLDPWQGIILEAANLGGAINFPMKARLEKEFGVPAFIDNDANLAALGEQRFGAGQNSAHLIYITISTGIGGGIIAEGKLFYGARGFAGEVGHQTLDAYGPRCNCGNVGCLEALAAGPAIIRYARTALRNGRLSKLRDQVGIDLDKLTGAMITQAARDGDALAKEIYARVGFFIGLGLTNLLHQFDTQLFVLGGGVALNTWDLIYPPMLKVFDKYAMPSMRRGVQIVPAQLGDDAGLLGAAALVLDKVQKTKDE